MTCDKVTYQTRTEAKKQAEGINTAKNTHLKPYQCPECGLFHLTTNNQHKKKRFNTGLVRHTDIPEPIKGSKMQPFMKKSTEDTNHKPATFTIGELLQGLMNAPKPTEEEAKIRNNQ